MNRFSPSQLSDVLTLVDGAWSQASRFEATGVHHGYRQVTVILDGHLQIPDLGWLVEPFQPVWNAWLSWIDPGGFIVEHRDAGPYRERWQVPITGDGQLAHGPDVVRHEVGVPFRVHHHTWHSVTNTSPAPRVSLVVDRDELIDIPSAPFEVNHGSR